jgi:peptide chain release factor 1
MADIFDKVQPIVQRYHAIEAEMAQPEVAADYSRLGEMNRERTSLENFVSIDTRFRRLNEEMQDLRSLVGDGGDPEIVEMAQLELSDCEERLTALSDELKVALLPRDPNDERNVIVEIHAAAGGQEASLFAGDLYRMYQRYAQERGWIVEILDSNPSDLGGFNRIAFSVDGEGAYSNLKFEAGVHRVQRVPETEAQGRIHTSTATVAVLPQADEVELNISDDDLRIDIFHAGGHGGQNVNKVATAVRIVHEPTGLVVVCQDERSQYKNKSKAMTILRSRLFAAEQDRKQAAISTSRKAQIGSGDRSEKMRTYNYPQDRVTDHRIGASIHGMQRIMDGGLKDLIEQIVSEDRAPAWKKHPSDPRVSFAADEGRRPLCLACAPSSRKRTGPWNRQAFLILASKPR